MSDPRSRMVATNLDQAAFYDGQARAWQTARRRPNLITRAWASLRDSLIASARHLAGVDELTLETHRSWIGDLRGCDVLDLGCFKGNALSLWLAEHAGSYTGIDLSAAAIDHLTTRIAPFPNARAIARDFLANEFPDASFDIVYAYSVLHHFEHFGTLLAELRRILRPGGVVVSLDPLMMDPVNRLARVLYRPLQADRDWEFPFTRRTLERIAVDFEITNVLGTQGMVRLAYPLLALSLLRPIARHIASWGREFDRRHAIRPGLALWMCWHVSLRFRRRSTQDGQGSELAAAVRTEGKQGSEALTRSSRREGASTDALTSTR